MIVKLYKRGLAQRELYDTVFHLRYNNIRKLFDKRTKNNIPDINCHYKEGNTVLHLSILRNKPHMGKILLDLGASIEIKNDKGLTPLHCATIFHRIEMVINIIGKGANINCLDKENNTPLMKATFIGHKDLTELFLSLKANIDIKNTYGESCIDLIPNYEIYQIYKNYCSIEQIQKNRNSYSRKVFEKNHYVKLNGRRDLIRQLLYKEKKLTDLIRNSNEYFELYKEDIYADKSFTGLPNKTKLSNFDIIELLGKGGFGEVYLVKLKNTENVYALKAVDKKKVLKGKGAMIKYIQVERDVYTKFHCPFIVKFYRAFQSPLYLYQLIEFAPNGSLKQFIKKYKTFSEDIVRIISAQIIIAFEHLHKQHIIYRDLKPDNILFDKDGYVKLTDFGLCKEGVNDNRRAKSFCGSLQYIPPEILNKLGHGRAADWYLLGTVIYEMLTGKPPYFSPCGKDIIMNNIRYGELIFPQNISKKAVSLLKSLLDRNVDKRLGASRMDSEEVKSHSFYKKVNFEKIFCKRFLPPEIFRHPMEKEPIKLNKPKDEWYCFRDLRYEKGEVVLSELDGKTPEKESKVVESQHFLDNWDFDGFTGKNDVTK